MDKEKILFVEGPNDREIIYRIENEYSLRDICVVKPCDSVDEAKSKFELYINENASKVQAVGLVIDADQDFEARWNSLKNMLNMTSNYDVPQELPVDGLVLYSKKGVRCPKVGLWIMPNNHDSGMIEDFLLSQIDRDKSLMHYIDDVLLTLKQNGMQKFKDVHLSKAKAHTFLAWQDTPGCSLAIAIEHNYFNRYGILFNTFANWMQRLYMP